MKAPSVKAPSIPALYNGLSKLPQGKTVFTKMVSFKAPYFASAHPRVKEVGPHRAVVEIPLRRSNQNHIGTVHVIAICNGMEFAMGMLAESTTPKGWRWLPKGMDVKYVGLATSDIQCVAETTEEDWTANLPDVPVKVTGRRDDGEVVVEGYIHLHVTEKKSKK